MAINRKEQGMSEDTPKSELQRKLEILINTEKLEEIYGIPDHLMSKMIISFIDGIGKFDPLAKIKAIEEEEIKEIEVAIEMKKGIKIKTEARDTPHTTIICPHCTMPMLVENRCNEDDSDYEAVVCNNCRKTFSYLIKHGDGSVRGELLFGDDSFGCKPPKHETTIINCPYCRNAETIKKEYLSMFGDYRICIKCSEVYSFHIDVNKKLIVNKSNMTRDELKKAKEPECKHKNPETVVICPYCSTGNKREYVGDPNNSDAINKITRCRSCNSSFIYLLDNPYRVYGKMVGVDGGYDK